METPYIWGREVFASGTFVLFKGICLQNKIQQTGEGRMQKSL